MTFINCTPHTINLNNGESFDSKFIARVSSNHSEFVNGICSQEFGDILGLPEPQEGVLFIVSAIVLSAVKLSGRNDCVAPATGHSDTIRNDKGHIISVPGFIK